MDGVDAVLASFPSNGRAPRALAHAHLPFDADLKRVLMQLQAPGDNEIDLEAQAANVLARIYADCSTKVLQKAGLQAQQIAAIGVHGQTVRHRPERGYTRQTNNPALLAELTGMDVIADFRSRDIAAGGQGAPLVPAFHQHVFGSATQCRVVANIGGIANISVLRPGDRAPKGFDSGPGNALMDLWIWRHQQRAFDASGQWAQQGNVSEPLLARMLSEPYFALPSPKSTGRDLFHAQWLEQQMRDTASLPAVDVQRTLCELTARSLAAAIADNAADAKHVFVCGGGAHNAFLLERLRHCLSELGVQAIVETTDALGVPPDQVEALAFAWLAWRFLQRKPGNLPSVTGARGERVLGALYPA